MAWTGSSAQTRPDSIPEGADPFIALKRRAVQAHWLKLAHRLPRRAAVLEIGAGSCLVSKWLIAARPDLTITATDCGDYPVDPAGLGPICFIPNTAIEALPFEDRAFDAVVSQFAFEYADREPALGQCGRVLRDKGRLSFLMHARGGALHDACALRIAGARMILEPPSLLDLLVKAADIPDAALRLAMYRMMLAPRIADRLQRLAALEAGAGISLPSLRDFLQGAAHHALSPQLPYWLHGAADAFSNSLFVGEDQLRVAMDCDAIDRLSTLAQALGLTPAKPRLSDIAWAWSATR